MNNINLLGTIGRIELKTTSNGKTICEFSVAVPKRMDREKTNWFNCIAFNKTAETINQYFEKGSKIALTGEIDLDQYTNKEGQKVNTTKVLVNQFYFCGGSSKSNNQSNGLDFSSTINVTDDMLPF